jgi:hypothetical protein
MRFSVHPQLPRVARRFGLSARLFLAASAVCAFMGLSTATAGATTWTSWTDCSAWWMVPGTSVCLHSGEWYNGSQGGTNWEWPECHSWNPMYSCGDNHYGTYKYYGINVTWLHYTINSGISVPYTTVGLRFCINLNINRNAGGNEWNSNTSYPLAPWQSC